MLPQPTACCRHSLPCVDGLESRFLLSTVRQVDYDPIIPKSKLVYTEVEDGITGTETVTVQSRSTKVSGVDCWVQQTNDPDGSKDLSYLNVTSAHGAIQYKEAIIDYDGTTTFTFNPVIPEFPAAMQVGRRYEGSSDVLLTVDGGSASGTFTYSMTAVRFEKITVPAGTFSAIKIAHTATFDLSGGGQRIVMAAAITTWHAKGIGGVQETEVFTTKTYQNGHLSDTETSKTADRLKSYSIPKAATAARKPLAVLASPTHGPGSLLGATRPLLAGRGDAGLLD